MLSAIDSGWVGCRHSRLLWCCEEDDVMCALVNSRCVSVCSAGTTASEVDVSREHLWLCVHSAEWCLVLWHTAVGDLLSRWASNLNIQSPYIHFTVFTVWTTVWKAKYGISSWHANAEDTLRQMPNTIHINYAQCYTKIILLSSLCCFYWCISGKRDICWMF